MHKDKQDKKVIENIQCGPLPQREVKVPNVRPALS